MANRIRTMSLSRVTVLGGDARKQNDQQRGNSAARGYDRAWRRLRLAYLREHPLCECDDCQAGAKRVTAASVVDHKQDIERHPHLRLEWSNLRAMSKRCHDRHTARTQAFGRKWMADEAPLPTAAPTPPHRNGG